MIVPVGGVSNSGLHGSAVDGETPAASSVIEFQTFSAVEIMWEQKSHLTVMSGGEIGKTWRNWLCCL